MASIMGTAGEQLDIDSAPEWTRDAIERVRAIGMHRLKRIGVPVGLIAIHYRCSVRTVYREMAAVRPEGRRLAN